MQIRRTKRKAVAPVLATLMMIAVAVAMSVIIFVWSQGFLSQTSSAAGGQQSQQNLAASSGISLEAAILNGATSSSTNGTITLVVRNVGTVAVTIGSITVQGTPSNTGLTSSGVFTNPYGTGTLSTVKINSATCKSSQTAWASFAKGNACTITIGGFAKSGSATPMLLSGDSINIKITTTVGTFANSQYTVP